MATPYQIQRFKDDTAYFFRTLRPSNTKRWEECGDHALGVQVAKNSKGYDELVGWCDDTKLVTVPISSTSTGFRDACEALKNMIILRFLPKFYPANKYKSY